MRRKPSIVALGVTLIWLLAVGVALACHTSVGVGPPGSVVVWGEVRLAGNAVPGAKVWVTYRDSNGTLLSSSPAISENSNGDHGVDHYATSFPVTPGETSKTITVAATYDDGGTLYGAETVVTLTAADLWTSGATAGSVRLDLLLDPQVTPHPPVIWGRVNLCTGEPVDNLLVQLFPIEARGQTIGRGVVDPGGSFEIRLGSEWARQRGYIVRLTLADPSGRFAIYDGDSMESPVWVERFVYWDDATSRRGSLTANFNPNSPVDATNAPDPAHAPDLIASYGHMATVVQWIYDKLGYFLPARLHVRLFSGVPASGYDPDSRTIRFTPNDSRCDDPDRPVNREWHETFHDLMEVGMPGGIPALAAGDVNHGGWHNATTRDSWAEGWATGWAMMVADSEGYEKPWAYPVNGYRTDLEFNIEPRDPTPTLLATQEEFAIAGLLWDLYDGPPHNIDASDLVQASPGAIWNALRTRTGAPLVDVLDVYSQTQVSAAALGTTRGALSRLFLIHGLYADLNDNFQYDAGEQIGRVAEGSRPTRRNVEPLPGAAIDFTVAAGPMPRGRAIRLWVFTDYQDDGVGRDYTFAMPVQPPEGAKPPRSRPSASVQRATLNPPPARVDARIILWLATDDGAYRSDLLTITAAEFWALVAQAPSGGAAISHGFTMRQQLYLPVIRRAAH